MNPAIQKHLFQMNKLRDANKVGGMVKRTTSRRKLNYEPYKAPQSQTPTRAQAKKIDQEKEAKQALILGTSTETIKNLPLGSRPDIQTGYKPQNLVTNEFDPATLAKKEPESRLSRAQEVTTAEVRNMTPEERDNFQRYGTGLIAKLGYNRKEWNNIPADQRKKIMTEHRNHNRQPQVAEDVASLPDAENEALDKPAEPVKKGGLPVISQIPDIAYLAVAIFAGIGMAKFHSGSGNFSTIGTMSLLVLVLDAGMYALKIFVSK